jgi:sirohydrochlorin ferrochelatase
MKVVLIDNGSLEAAAHAALRAAARAIGEKAGAPVEAVSWKHSGRVPAQSLQGGPAQTLSPWIRAQVAAGEREFLFVPFFISPQGAIGSALRSDLGKLQEQTGGFEFSFATGLSGGTALAGIITDRVRQAMARKGLMRPAVVIVDHGGPSTVSAGIRDRVADAARSALGSGVLSVTAASMESPDGPEFAFNQPLLAEVLSSPAHASADVLIAPLFLSPGRHAGPSGDLERIARAARERAPGLRCHFTELVGSHPIAIDTLAAALAKALRVGALP